MLRKGVNRLETIRILLVPLGSVEPVNVLSEKDTMIRMREAFVRWSRGGWDYILVTGGAFTSKKIMTRPGAQVMTEWFIEQGVPQECILVEGESRDTYQNTAKSIKLIDGVFPDKKMQITVITQWQHAIRFWITFRAYGVRVYLLPLYYKMGAIGISREFVLIMLTAIDPKGRFVGWVNQTLFRQNR